MAAILTLCASIAALAAVSMVARQAPSMRAGILWGVVTGLGLSLVFGAAAGFLAHIIPVGQLDFWIAGWLYKLGLAG